jgi:hypothetical protein
MINLVIYFEFIIYIILNSKRIAFRMIYGFIIIISLQLLIGNI